jgi:acyl-coenzyme A synthetase/AMP-(fatty) acid ligase
VVGASGRRARVDRAQAWRWYYEVVGDKRCSIVDTYWQTETGTCALDCVVR